MPNTLKDHGRQYVLWAYQSAGFADLPTGVATEVIDLPPNAVIVGGFSEVSEAFNDGTSAVANIGITGAATTFETAQDLSSTTNPAVEFAAGLFTNTGANGTAVIVTPTYGANDNTAGILKIGVAYILPNRANENQPY
jgi:hypothetical protein